MKVSSLDEINKAILFLNKSGPACSVELNFLLHTAREYHKEKARADTLCEAMKAATAGIDAAIELRTGEYHRMREALISISKNGCCDTCQEAKLVALKALKESAE